MVTTPFGVLCTSILAPGPAFFAQSGFVTPEAGFAPTLVTTSIGRFLLRIGRNFGGFNGRGYIQQTAMQTDFRKFDGALRMILDLDEPRRAELSGYLARAHDSGELCFGIHGSEHALMTCFIQDYMGRHVHFVDGGDGGYAMAARQLKAQRKSRVEVAA